MRRKPSPTEEETFTVEGVQYRLTVYRHDLDDPHVEVSLLDDPLFTVMVRGLDYGSRPFWVGGYAISQPELRDAIATAVAALTDGPTSTGSV